MTLVAGSAKSRYDNAGDTNTGRRPLLVPAGPAGTEPLIVFDRDHQTAAPAAVGGGAPGPVADRSVAGREYPLLWVLAAAAAGIIVDRTLAVPPFCWGLLFATLLLPTCWFYLRQCHRTSAFLLLAAVTSVAGLWHHDRWYLYAEDEIARLATDMPAPVVARVQVLDAPRHSPAAREGPFRTMTRGASTRLTVRLLAVRHGPQWRSASGRAALIVEDRLAPDGPLRGDQLEVAALLARVREALNPGEPDFAGMCRGRRQRVVLLCEHRAGLHTLHRAGPWSVLRQLGRFRLAAEAALDRYVGPARSPLAAALVLGSRERLDPEVVERFFVSGTLHLLAISGLHVGILATVFWLLIRLNWLPRHRVLWIACLLIVGYALLTGARPPVIRAAILVVVYSLARGLGRPPHAWNALSAAGLVTLAIRPSALFDTGTQLSFLAVASLLAMGPFLTGVRQRDPLNQLIVASQPFWFRALRWVGRRSGQLLAISAAIWLVSLPLVTLRFHLAAPIGLVLNLLLCIPVAAAYFTALLTILLAPVPWLPNLCGHCCNAMLWIIEYLTLHGAQLSVGHHWVAGPPSWLVVLFYVGLGLRQFAPLRVPRRWWCAMLSGWVMLAVATGCCAQRIWRAETPQPLRMSFIAVGHGTSVLVEFPNGEVLLYDAGRMGIPRAAALPISSVLWSRRIHHIDAIALSHADADHFNAVPALLDRFSVGIVYVSPLMFQSPSPAIDALQSTMVESQVPIGYLAENMRLDVGPEMTAEILHPPASGCTPGQTDGGDNGNSVVIRISYGRHAFLLTGDLEGAGLDELLAEQADAVQVLLAPHHGSRNSRPAEIVRWADPSVVVISAGAGLPITAVQPVYARNGALVFWTHRDGMIEITSDGTTLQLAPFRRPDFVKGTSAL